MTNFYMLKLICTQLTYQKKLPQIKNKKATKVVPETFHWKQTELLEFLPSFISDTNDD